MTFPYPVHHVPGAQALEKRAQLQQENGGFAVILGSEETLEFLEENAEFHEESTDDLIRQALEIDALQWFADQQAEMDADAEEWADDAANDEFDDESESDPDSENEAENESEPLEWPDSPDKAQGEIISHQDILTGDFLDTVILASIPAQENWQIPCYLKLGGWNACPPPAEMAAICKFWQERHGTQIVCATADVLEMQVARPPQTKEEALELAQQQYLFCNDIVDQGVGDVESLAKTLLYSPVWYFWWD